MAPGEGVGMSFHEQLRDIMSGKTSEERARAIQAANSGVANLEQGTLGELGRRYRMEMLQDRLAAAERKRQARLDAVRARAAARGAAARAAAAAAREGAAAEAAAAGRAADELHRSLSIEVIDGKEDAEAGTLRLVMDRVAELRIAEGLGRRSRSPRAHGSPRASALRQTRRSAAGHSVAEARRARWLAQLQAAAAAQRAQLRAPGRASGGGGELDGELAAGVERLRMQASSRRVQRLWRAWAAQRKTTRALAAAFAECGVVGGAPPPARSPAGSGGGDAPREAGHIPLTFVGGMLSEALPKHERFDSFAEKLQAPRTLRAAAALLRRLEARLAARGAAPEAAQALLRRLFPAAAAGGRPVERYPVRVALVAFMIREHPEVVFNKVGDVEAQLSAAARAMLSAFEALLSKLLEPEQARAAPASPVQGASPLSPLSPLSPFSPLKEGAAAVAASRRSSLVGQPSAASASPHAPLGALLEAFDDSWLEYLDQFVVWKGRDAASLEQDLIGVAVKLETSMRQKLAGRDPDSEVMSTNGDMQAMVAQVRHDHSLLHERVLRLTGAPGVARLDAALTAARAAAEAEVLANDGASEASWESASEASRSRGPSRANSRPLSRSASAAKGDDAAFAAAAPSPREQPGRQAPAPPQAAAPEGPSNEQMVWELLYNPQFSLPVAEAEAAWARALGRADPQDEEMDDAEAMSPEQIAAAVARRARAIAERAFWDSIEWRFATSIQGGGLPAQLAPLVSELGLELASLLAGAGSGGAEGPAAMEAAQLEEVYVEPRVLARLASRTGAQGGGANLTAALASLEQLGRGVLAAAAPARAEAASAPFAAALAELSAAAGAAAAGDSGAEGAAAADSAGRAAALARGLAPALARALRLTMAQIKLAKLDAANARLSALAAAMRERGAVAYLRTKLAAGHRLPEPGSAAFTRAALAERLPRTAAWVASLGGAAGGGAAGGEVEELRRALAAAGLDLSESVAAAAAMEGGLEASVTLRTGLRAPPRAAPGGAAPGDGPPPARDAFGLPAAPGAGAGAAEGAVQPAQPALAGSWRGALRAALVALVSRDAPAAAPGGPEVLSHDRERLHALQNGLQQLAVAAAGLLIAQQLRAAGGAPWAHDARAAARRRLMVVLSDPGMRLSDLITEIARVANDGAPQGAPLADEDRVRGMFTSVVDPAGTAFKSVRAALGAALLAHALYGRAAMAPDGGPGRAAAAALARVGAGPLYGDVAALGERLAAVAGVVEAVWGDALAALL
ncbi:MAG: hypothetical protein J3K34DRAFT_459391 [Monoraphidium minutum]|nr:MAG: hypothetical protein J3K34DRAFT_459391 [Monoraphidium minutum]